MYTCFAIIGFLLLIAEILAWRYTTEAFNEKNLSKGWRKARILILIPGFVICVGLLMFNYYPSPDVRVLGLPFLSAVFELHNGHWVDFVGIITFPATIGNLAVGLLFPQLIFAAIVWKKSLIQPFVTS